MLPTDAHYFAFREPFGASFFLTIIQTFPFRPWISSSCIELHGSRANVFFSICFLVFISFIALFIQLWPGTGKQNLLHFRSLAIASNQWFIQEIIVTSVLSANQTRKSSEANEIESFRFFTILSSVDVQPYEFISLHIFFSIYNKQFGEFINRRSSNGKANYWILSHSRQTNTVQYCLI